MSDSLFLKQFIRSIPDFPEPGIIYRDITPLLLSAEALSYAVDQFLAGLPTLEIDKVVGIESRGFFFSTLLANRLNAGIVPLRKKGKLPAKTLSAEYDLEYGSAQLEIHQDAIQPNDKILIHDDVLATGGTAKAACELVEKLGGEIVQLNFLLELSDLGGKEKIKGYNINSLLSY